jgi:hypothetical protein
VNATLILLLSRFCKNFEVSLTTCELAHIAFLIQSQTIARLFDLCEQQLHSPPLDTSATRVDTLVKAMGTLSRRLLDRYVHMEAFALSQLLVKSVETRDWLQCAEPRSVRAVAKRVLEVSRPSCDFHILARAYRT